MGGRPRLNIKLTTIKMVVNFYNFLIFLTNTFNKFKIKSIKANFCVKGFTRYGSELVGITINILKRDNTALVSKEILKRNARTLDAGIGTEITRREVVRMNDVNNHFEVPFRFFLNIL